MTFEEMCNILAQEYPEYIDWSALTLAKADWKHSASGSKYGGYTITQNESIKVSAGGDTYGSTTRTLTSVNTYDLSKYKKLRLKGTATWSSSENYSAWRYKAQIFIIDADTSTTLVQYDATFVSSGTRKYTATIDEDITLPDLTDINCQLKISVFSSCNNNAQGTTSLTINDFTFYSKNEILGSKTYIFNEGVINTDLVGSINKDGWYVYATAYPVASDPTITNNELVITSTGGTIATLPVAGCSNAINLDNYSKICAEISSSTYGCRIQLCKGSKYLKYDETYKPSTDILVDIAQFEANSASTIVELNVESYTGDYYIAITGVTSAGTVTIKNWWLE